MVKISICRKILSSMILINVLSWTIPIIIPNAISAESDVGTEVNNNYQPAWIQLKQLAGTWDSHIVGRDNSQAIISYHITSGGSVLLEEFIGDKPDGVHDMATAYHLDVNDLIATHYCGAGNQPRMRAAYYDPDAKLLRFDFWDITHLPDPQSYYTTNIELYFKDDKNIELRFRGKSKGVMEDWQVHRLRRLSNRPYKQ